MSVAERAPREGRRRGSSQNPDAGFYLLFKASSQLVMRVTGGFDWLEGVDATRNCMPFLVASSMTVRGISNNFAADPTVNAPPAPLTRTAHTFPPCTS